MAIDALASRTVLESLRLQTSQTHARLSEAASEVSSGRHYDMGLALGETTSRLLDLQGEVRDNDSLVSSNNLTSNRLSQADAALASASELAAGFLDALVAARSGGDRGLLVADATNRLHDLIGLMSLTSNGAYAFAGQNSATAPLANYTSSPPGSARSQILSAFTTEFGFAPTDPLVTTMSAAQLAPYLDGQFRASFEPPVWNTSFSAATDQLGPQRISPSQVIDIPGSANDPGIRGLMAALVAVIDTGTQKLNAESFTTLADWASKTVGAASAELTNSRAAIGSTQERLAKASDGMVTRSRLLQAAVGKLEDVDADEASTRLLTLQNQLEASYAVTARLQQISLLNYL